MYKLPKGIKIVIFILLLGLQFFVLTLIRTVYVENKAKGYTLEFTELQFYIIFGIVSAIAIGIGLILPSQFQAWTIETFIERQNNVVTIDKTIISLHQKRAALCIQTPELKQIPQAVQVWISSEKLDFRNQIPTNKIRKGAK